MDWCNSLPCTLEHTVTQKYSTNLSSLTLSGQNAALDRMKINVRQSETIEGDIPALNYIQDYQKASIIIANFPCFFVLVFLSDPRRCHQMTESGSIGGRLVDRRSPAAVLVLCLYCLASHQSITGTSHCINHGKLKMFVRRALNCRTSAAPNRTAIDEKWATVVELINSLINAQNATAETNRFTTTKKTWV